MEHSKVLSATMVGRQETFLNSKRSGMAKTVTFWLWWQSFNSFCFKALCFFLCLSFFFLLRKKVGKGGWGRRGMTRCRQPCIFMVLNQVKCYERFNHKKTLSTYSFEYSSIFGPLIITNSFSNATKWYYLTVPL